MRAKLLLIAFFEGFFFLCFELLGAQFMHPIYGDSYFVWLGTISLTMLAATLGYFFGGIWYRLIHSQLIIFILTIAVIITGFTISSFGINDYLSSALNETGIIAAFIIHLVVMVGVPVFVITSLSPVLVGLLSEEIKEKGKAASQVFFASTIGGIAAVYLLAFVLIPNLDLIRIQYILAGLSIILTIGTFMHAKKRLVGIYAFIVLLMFISAENNTKPDETNTKIVHRSNGIMGEIEISDKDDKYRFLRINRTFQSGIQLKEGRSIMRYHYKISFYASLYPVGSKVLLAGLGGGVMVGQLKSLGFEVEVVDFDKRLLALSRKYMGLKSNFNFYADDIRHYLNRTHEKYDLIILDLSKGESIPVNVFTIEAFEQMKKRLNGEGAIFINYFSVSGDSGTTGLNSIIKTSNAAGFFTALVKKPPNDRFPEEFIIATQQMGFKPNSSFRSTEETQYELPFLKSDFLHYINGQNLSGQILVDDKNRLESMQFRVVVDFRNNVRRDSR